MAGIAATQAKQIVSPVVIQYAPDATIGLTTDAQETVTVNGISETFTYPLADATAARAFLDAFDLSGLRYDEKLPGQVDEDLSALELTVTAAIKDYIVAAVNGGATAAGGATLKAWLEAQLRAAFVVAFPDYMVENGAGANIPDSGSNDVGAGQSAVAAAVPGTQLPPGGTAVEDSPASSLATIVRQTFINSFAVDVDVSGAPAADAFVDQFNAAAALLRRSLYRQIAKDSWIQYYTTGDPAAGIGAGLPLLGGDKLVFVFDVDVNATTGATEAGAPTPAESNTILLNMGNRRVALEFLMPGADGIIARA